MSWEQQKAQELLEEINSHTGPEKLEEWNIKAQALLVFVFMKQHCTGVPVAEQKAGQKGLFEHNV